MIKAIVFDYFGVIFSDDYWRVVREDKNLGGRFHELSNSVNLGEITWDQFVETLSSKIGAPVEKIRQMYESEKIDPRMIAYIAKLHQNYKTGLLTNAHHAFLEPVLKKAHLRDLFDAVVLSSRVGFVKPDPAIFQCILDEPQVQPEEVVFIDDITTNIDAAAKLGIQGILYTNFDDFQHELKPLLTDSNN